MQQYDLLVGQPLALPGEGGLSGIGLHLSFAQRAGRGRDRFVDLAQPIPQGRRP